MDCRLGLQHVFLRYTIRFTTVGNTPPYICFLPSLSHLPFFYRPVLPWTHTSNKALAYTFFYYRNTIALQSSLSFFCTMKWISYMCTYNSSLLNLLLTPGPIPPITEHRVMFPMLYSRFLRATYITHGGVYMSVLTSQFTPSLPFFLCVHMSILYYCPGNKFISTIFLDSMYALIYDICFSLSDFLYSVRAE